MYRTALLNLLLLLAISTCLQGQSVTASSALTNNINGRTIDYTLTPVNTNDASFYIFEDGHCSIQRNPRHEHHSNGTYAPRVYSIKAYDDDDILSISTPNPVVINSTTTTSGSNTSRQSMSTQNIRVGQSWRAAEDSDMYYIISFRHPGFAATTTTSGEITFDLPPGIQVLEIVNPDINISPNHTFNNWANRGSFSPSNSIFFGDQIKWRFNNLSFSSSEIRHLYVKVRIPPIQVGTSITSTVRMDFDGEGYSETRPLQSTIHRYAHDPNGIRANYDCIRAGHFDAQQIEYTVDFQNDGNWYANTVTIEINPGVQLSTNAIEVVNSSHPVGEVSVANGYIYITFNEINLPGSNQHTPHTYTYDQTTGHVTFSICTEENMMGGEIILTDAQIYFDQLPPVYTGMSFVFTDDFCTLADSCSGPPADASVLSINSGTGTTGYSDIQKVYPNPFTGIINIPYNISAEYGTDVEINLFSLSGKQVGDLIFEGFQLPGNHQITYDGSGLSAGIYLLKIRKGNQIENHRIVKIE